MRTRLFKDKDIAWRRQNNCNTGKGCCKTQAKCRQWNCRSKKRLCV